MNTPANQFWSSRSLRQKRRERRVKRNSEEKMRTYFFHARRWPDIWTSTYIYNVLYIYTSEDSLPLLVKAYSNSGAWTKKPASNQSRQIACSEQVEENWEKIHQFVRGRAKIPNCVIIRPTKAKRAAKASHEHLSNHKALMMLMAVWVNGSVDDVIIDGFRMNEMTKNQ